MRKSKNAKNANAESYIDIMEKNHMEIPWHDYASADSNVLICKAGLIEKASVIGRVGLIMLSCGTGACAAAVCAIQQKGMENKVLAEVPGGTLTISWNGNGKAVFLSGPAEFICDAFISIHG